MAKYSSFVYSSAKYGTGDAGAQPTYNGLLLWILLVDWSGAGWTNESPYLTYPVFVERGKEFWVSRNGQGLEKINPGRCSLTLVNTSGRFDAYNSSSDIYPNVAPNKRIRLSVKDLTSGTTYPVFQGWTTNIQPAGVDTVTVEAVDDLEMLNRNDANIPTTFKTTLSEGMKQVLRCLDMDTSGVETWDQPLQVFSASDENALGVVNELANASLGNIFVDRSGKFRYYPYTYDSMASTSIDEDVVSKVIKLAQPWEELRNDITVYANGYVRTAPKVIWAASGDVVVPASGSLSINAEWSGICQPITPVAGTDYDNFRYLTGIGGSWISAFSVSLSGISTKGATITISNSAPYSVGTKLQVRGTEYVQSYTVTQRAPDYYYNPQPATTSTASTKQRYDAADTTIPVRQRAKFVLDSRYQHSRNFAQSYVTLLKDKLKAGTKNPQFIIRGRPAYQFAPELMDKIAFTSGTKGISATYKLGAVRHEWMDEGGQDVSTTFSLIDPLYSTAVPTAEDIPEVPPEIPGNPGGDTPPLPDPGGGLTNCLYNAPANGPYAVGLAGTYTNYGTDSSKSAGFKGILRSAGIYWNPSRFNLSGQVEVTTDGKTWTPSSANITVTFWKGSVKAYTTTASYAGGTVAGANIGLGVGAAEFDAVQLSMEETAGTYTYKDPQTFTFDAGAGSWVTTSDGYGYCYVVAAGGYSTPYCIEAASTVGEQSQKFTYSTYTYPAPVPVVEGMSVSAWVSKIYQNLYGQGDTTCQSYLYAIFSDNTSTFVGSNLTVGGWTQYSIDLTAYVGKSLSAVQIKTICNSRSTATWHIDDITIPEAENTGNKRMTITDFSLYNICPV